MSSQSGWGARNVGLGFQFDRLSDWRQELRVVAQNAAAVKLDHYQSLQQG